MSQLLEVARARGRRRRAPGDRRLGPWTGGWARPAHAHAVAAGFLARAGDREGARASWTRCCCLEDWRADRSYLWSVFVGERRDGGGRGGATATCAAGCSTTCARCGRRARSTVRWSASWARTPITSGSCTPRSGSGRRPRCCSARRWATHERLGARGWAAETSAALARVLRGGVALRAVGEVWEVGYARPVCVRARLQGGPRSRRARLAPGRRRTRAGAGRGCAVRRALRRRTRPGRPGGVPAPARGAGRRAYRCRVRRRRRPAERASVERETVLAELRRSTRPDGSSRGMVGSDAERARKAVSARIRDAILGSEAVLPGASASHLRPQRHDRDLVSLRAAPCWRRRLLP